MWSRRRNMGYAKTFKKLWTHEGPSIEKMMMTT
jgi:hypothetical protein